MQFVNPLFLFGLISLAIPVIIHLFNFRRYKRVYFTNVRFLAEIQQETKQQSQLKQILILIARLLAIACLVLAFSRPFIPSDKRLIKSKGQRSVSIYIDNSWSMDAVGADGKLIDIAKKKAIEIAAAYAPSDLFQLVTNDFEGRHQHFVTQEEILKTINEVTLSPTSRPLPAIISRQNDILTGNFVMNRDAYLISDFQLSSSRLTAVRPDTSINWFFIPVQAEKRNNLYVDSVWFKSPIHQARKTVQLMVRIRNLGPAMEKVPVKLTINNIQKAVASFSVPVNSYTDIVIPYTEEYAGPQFGKITISDYPIVYDDQYYFAYQVLPSIPVLTIYEETENKYLNALFQNDSSFLYRNSARRQIDYGSLSRYSLIILNSPAEISSGLREELIRYVNGGGNLVIFPPSRGDIKSLNSLCNVFNTSEYRSIDTNRQRVASLSLENDIFNEIFEKTAAGKIVIPDNSDLPTVFKHYKTDQHSMKKSEVLMKLHNGDPMILSTLSGKGMVYWFSTPLEQNWTNFMQHLLFVPVLYRIALLSNATPPLAYTVGSNAAIELIADSVSEKDIHRIVGLNSEFSIIPETRSFGSGITLYTHDQIKEAGFYLVKSEKNKGIGIAFNYNRSESDLECIPTDILDAEIKRLPFNYATLMNKKNTSLTSQIHQLNQGTPLWKIFILMALLFLAIEILLIRFLKN